MTKARRALLGVAFGVVVIGVGAAVFRGPIARAIVRFMTPEYVAPAALAQTRGRVRLLEVARGFEQPTDIQFVPGKARVAVVLEKRGRARVADVSSGPERVANPGAPVLEVKVNSDSEMGLLGLAFHPKYAENGRFFVNYNPEGGKLRTIVSEWNLPSGEVGKRPATEVRKILEVEQPYPNHKAGQLAFGPDGFLYVGLGDGGWKNDPHGHGQNLATLLGSMLRLDVEQAPYRVPTDNPFVGRKDARPEIWAYGLRNPWRFGFDPRGRLIVADVGQDRFEEIDIVKKGDNMGWNVREATHCFEPKVACRSSGLVDPIFEYGRELGTSVTGGYVYTGDAVEDLADKYVFADFTSGNIWALVLPNPDLPSREPAKAEVVGTFPYLISTFGRDETGEIYAADYAGGGIYRFVARR